MSIIDQSEPTTFELDVYFAAGAQGDAKLDEHVQQCERCADYLAKLAALELPALAPPKAARRRGSPRKLVAAGAFVSVCAALALWVNTGEHYVGEKGLPAVQVLIRSPSAARVWDGKSALRAGDAIALRTDCDPFTHVTVAVADGEAWNRVYEGRCKQGEPLPFTLVADDKPGSEQIEVVFSRGALGEAALRRAITTGERSDTAWVSTVKLDKEGNEP